MSYRAEPRELEFDKVYQCSMKLSATQAVGRRFSITLNVRDSISRNNTSALSL